MSAPLDPTAIRLCCPKCGREKFVERESTDPAEAEVAILPCPDCGGSDIDCERFFGADGHELEARKA